MSKKKIHIGTSGWHYDHWKGPFYPKDIHSNLYLEYYFKYFDSVEINNTFYQLPDEKTLTHWRDSVPSGFVFSVKASRYITHMKKLKDPYDSLSTFIERVKVLEDTLGPILFQLPPKWNVNLERLNNFLEILPSRYRFAFEFRDERWFGEKIEKALSDKGASFCIYDFEKRQSPKTVTADFIYVRLHGPEGAYQGSYDALELSKWAQKFESWANSGKEIFCYFDNDEKGYAVHNALRIKELLKAGKSNLGKEE